MIENKYWSEKLNFQYFNVNVIKGNYRNKREFYLTNASK